MATQQDQIDRAMQKRLVKALEKIADKLDLLCELAYQESEKK
jgi:hypothetical protein